MAAWSDNEIQLNQLTLYVHIQSFHSQPFKVSNEKENEKPI